MSAGCAPGSPSNSSSCGAPGSSIASSGNAPVANSLVGDNSLFDEPDSVNWLSASVASATKLPDSTASLSLSLSTALSETSEISAFVISVVSKLGSKTSCSVSSGSFVFGFGSSSNAKSSISGRVGSDSSAIRLDCSSFGVSVFSSI